jgi:hypothetical protein
MRRRIGELPDIARAVMDGDRGGLRHAAVEFLERIEKRRLFRPVAEDARLVLEQAVIFRKRRRERGRSCESAPSRNFLLSAAPARTRSRSSGQK